MGAVADIAVWTGVALLVVGTGAKFVVLYTQHERPVLDAFSGMATVVGLLALVPGIYEGWWRIAVIAVCLLGLFFNIRAFARIWNRRQLLKTGGNFQA